MLLLKQDIPAIIKYIASPYLIGIGPRWKFSTLLHTPCKLWILELKNKPLQYMHSNLWVITHSTNTT
jgi:hypothetical protein